MSTKRVLLVVLVASAVMLAVGIGPRVAGSAHALPQAQEPDPPGARPERSRGVTIPYPGRLDDDAGQPVADGAYDFTFALYDTPTGGEPLWSEVREDVAVEGGTFNVLLGSAEPIPTALLDGPTGLTASGGERWLAVGVRGPGEAGFTALTPRQRLSAASPASPAAPSNGMTCPHDHWGETWEGSTGWLTLRNTSTGNEAMLPGWLSGVYGHSEDWAGVHGQSTSNIGVYGTSTDAQGVYGNSTNGVGVQGDSSTTHGVHGKTSGEWGWTSGVYGEASKTNAIGVTGWNTGAGTGVYAYSASGHGVYAKTDGVEWDSAVRAYSQNGKGIYAETGNPSNHAGYFVGQGYFSGLLTKAGGGFKIDHPLDPENKYLYHSFVESPDMKNVYDGVVMLGADGTAWVELPEWFEALNKDFRYQLTPIGAPGPNLYIAQEIQNNRFQIAGGPLGMKVSWQVTGIRHDPWAEAHTMPVEEEKPPEEGGTYLHPVEHGMPETSGLHYQQNQALERPLAGGRR